MRKNTKLKRKSQLLEVQKGIERIQEEIEGIKSLYPEFNEESFQCPGLDFIKNNFERIKNKKMLEQADFLGTATKLSFGSSAYKQGKSDSKERKIMANVRNMSLDEAINYVAAYSCEI